jgi:Gram-negative bacterial TonB protein C-terminal
MRLLHTVLLITFLTLGASGIGAQDSPLALPGVVQHAEPVYPAIARTAHITGEVRVKISTDGESVREAEAESGPALLRKPAEDNARTWKFAPHTPGTFRVTFRYKIMSSGTEVEFLESPAIIQIVAEPSQMSIYYGSIGLGKRKAQLKNARGKSSQVFELSDTGADGEWLDGEAVDPSGKSEESDFGHKDGDMLGFTIKLTQPNGQEVKTFLIGKMTANKIVGTFVDETGERGEWNAVRVPEPPITP